MSLTGERGLLPLVVTETKTPRSRRVVPLSPTAERLLREVRANQRVERPRAGSMWQPTPYVFTSFLAGVRGGQDGVRHCPRPEQGTLCRLFAPE
jgi:hypothetical protein